MSCLKCKHFFADIERPNNCDAFPEGIPFVIISGSILHDKPLDKQGNDIVFEPIKE